MTILTFFMYKYKHHFQKMFRDRVAVPKPLEYRQCASETEHRRTIQVTPSLTCDCTILFLVISWQNLGDVLFEKKDVEMGLLV